MNVSSFVNSSDSKKKKMLKVKITNPRKSTKKKVNYLTLTQCKEAITPIKTETENDKRSSSKKQKNIESRIQSVARKNSGNYARQKKLATERQRRRRARMTAEELDIKRQKDRERYYKKKEKKIILPISQRSPRDQRLQRKEWQKNSKNYRTRKSLSKNLTLQASDDEDATQSNTSSDLYETPQSSSISTFNGVQESKQKKNAKKQVNEKEEKAYHIIKKQNNTIKQLQRELEEYKKRYNCLMDQTSTLSPSPRKELTERSDSDKLEGS